MSALFGHYLENICSQGTFLHVFEEERKHLFCFLQIRGSSVLRRGVSFKYLSISSMLADMGLSGCNTFVSDGGIYLLYYNSCEFDWSRYICTFELQILFCPLCFWELINLSLYLLIHIVCILDQEVLSPKEHLVSCIFSQI